MIKWKLRVQNKNTLIALISAGLTFIYTVLEVIEIVPAIQKEQIWGIVEVVLIILMAQGIVVDPTTKGLGDSARALNYKEPN